MKYEKYLAQGKSEQGIFKLMNLNQRPKSESENYDLCERVSRWYSMTTFKDFLW